MPDWNVIRGEVTDFGASENTVVVPFGETIVAANAIVRLTNIQKMSSGISAGSTGSHNSDDLGCTCHTITTTGFTLERQSTGYNTDVTVFWEALLGDFDVISYQEHTLADTETSITFTLTGFSDINQCVPIICGVRSANTVGQPQRDSIRPTITGTNTLNLFRGQGSNAVIVTVAVIEFDSNYTVQGPIDHELVADGVVGTTAIPSTIVIADSMVFHGYQTANNIVTDWGAACWIKDVDTLNFFRATGADDGSSAKHSAYVVSNSETLAVTHEDSIDNSVGTCDSMAEAGSPQTTNDAITAVADVAKTMILCDGVTEANDGNGGQNAVSYTLDADNNLKRFRTESVDVGADATVNFAQQIVELTNPSAGTIVERTLSDSIDVTDPTTKNVGMLPSESINIIDFLMKNKDLLFSDNIVIQPDVVMKVISMFRLGSLNVTDASSKQKIGAILDSIDMQDFNAKDVSKLVLDTMDMQDFNAKDVFKLLLDSVDVTDSLISQIVVEIVVTLTDAMDMTDEHTKQLIKTTLDFIDTTDSSVKEILKVLLSTLDVDDNLVVDVTIGAFFVSFLDSITVTDSHANETFKFILDTVGITDELIRSIVNYRLLENRFDVTDSNVKEVVSTLSSSFLCFASVIKDVHKVLGDSFDITDEALLTKMFNRFMLDTLDVTDDQVVTFIEFSLVTLTKLLAQVLAGETITTEIVTGQTISTKIVDDIHGITTTITRIH